jgi:hypothetical protein
MGIIACEVHGRQGFVEVCAHVGAALRGGTVLHRSRVLEVDVCDDCWQRHDLGRFTSETFFEWSAAAEAQYGILNDGSECHCVECVAVVELASARDQGRPDPFPAYERTLTFLQLDIVERLNDELLHAFDFRQSVVMPGRRALWVEYGSLTRPLTITIYYVTARESQEAILQFLAGFFEDLPKRQYRVRFYRSESWNQSPSNPRSWSRGPEELLREHELDPPERPAS